MNEYGNQWIKKWKEDLEEGPDLARELEQLPIVRESSANS
jgi:hypothetical protein